jgi:glycosyltransferase involved in cell wall biosynthesis
MKTFMLGWEFPPFISGGLGTACYGLSKALDQLGVKITFVLPKADPAHHTEHLKIISAKDAVQSQNPGIKTSMFKDVKFYTIASPLRPYTSPGTYEQEVTNAALLKGKNAAGLGREHCDCPNNADNYSGDLYTQVNRYAEKVAQIAAAEDFDIIHAHDWMTYPAGIAAAGISCKPLVVQVHATEFDRSGEHINQSIYDIERQGMHFASKVITVSNFTKNIIVERYGVEPEKVEVVYNGVERDNNYGCTQSSSSLEKTDKIVLFLGRITMQKGPEYFLAAAKKVLEVIKNVKFIMAGNGDMMNRTIELAARLGIGSKVLFTGFLRGDDVRKAYQMADLYVMPSVSEPFGIAPLEALQSNVPVLISKQSGIAEVLANALKVDFWDIREMADKIVAVLRHPSLQQTLKKNGSSEVVKFRWEDSAAKIKKIYEQLLVSV